jgi:glycerol-1-phosphate dehydrogenase [NAD(P)+]
MMAYLHRANWKRIKETLNVLGAPTNASQLGVEKKDVIEALNMAPTIRPERYTVLNKHVLDAEACEKIARTTQVI